MVRPGNDSMSAKNLVTRSSMPSVEKFRTEIRPLCDSRRLTAMGGKFGQQRISIP